MFGFGFVCGNTALLQNLRNAITAGRVPHASIFMGGKGLGKKLVAHSFAKVLLCTAGGTDACGRCKSCVVFETGNHPDFFRVKATKTKAIGVDDVREQITARLMIRPYQSRYKIFIVENAGTLTHAAQNALLKTIEEPAHYGIILLLCENQKLLLPTVLSRCVLFKLVPVSTAQVAQVLAERLGSLPEAQRQTYAAYAQGSIGRALTLCQDEDYIGMRSKTIELAAQLHNGTAENMLAYTKTFETFKENIRDMLDILYLYHRDVAAFKETGDNRFIIQKDKAQDIAVSAANLSLATVLKKCDAIALAKKQLRQNGNFQLVVQVLLMALV